MAEFSRDPTSLTTLRSSLFVHRELPVRLARRVMELNTLPHGLDRMPSIRTVADWYTQSFHELTSFPTPVAFGLPPPTSLSPHGHPFYGPHELDGVRDLMRAYNERFMQCISKIKRRHDPTVPTIARGVMEAKELWAKALVPGPAGQGRLPLEVQSFLGREGPGPCCGREGCVCVCAHS
jgi:pyruvate dehydrogenase kinase 2/3/4